MSTAPAHWSPVLQIVHVSDLHVKHVTANPAHALTGRGRNLSRRILQIVQRRDLLGWDDGTQGHYYSAPESFRRFLVRWNKKHPEWAQVQNWLIDTGDRTAFGDQASIIEGGSHLQMWSAALGNCPVRSLFGNHDAWPGTLPLLHPGGLQEQQSLVMSRPEWNCADWLSSPLSVPIPNGHIDLFAVDSVCWGVNRNTRAVGDISNHSHQALVARLRIAQANRREGLRILAMHHPLVFPWNANEARSIGVFSAMRLLGGDTHVRMLRNDADDPQGIGPLAHLIMGGHTHLAFPAGGLSGDVTSVHQGLLAPSQLQLVGGPLMLNKSRRTTRRNVPSKSNRNNVGFVPSTVDATNCQAQILQFRASEERPGILQMLRIPVTSIDGSAYIEGQPDGVNLRY
jgi:hypothetical protein